MAVNLAFSGGALAANVKLTLNGVDVTSGLRASGATMTVSLSQGMYVGANRLAATNGTDVSSLDFHYDPATTVGASTGFPAGAPTTATDNTILADVIPIQTRVRMTNASGQAVWGIQIGQTAYPAPNGTTQGFQVLVLNRRNLTVISNTNFQLLNDGDVYNFTNGVALGSANYSSKCGLPG